MDGVVLGIGLPASVLVILNDKTDTDCRSKTPTKEWNLTVVYFVLFLSIYYVILVTMAIRSAVRLFCQFCGKIRQRREF